MLVLEPPYSRFSGVLDEASRCLLGGAEHWLRYFVVHNEYLLMLGAGQAMTGNHRREVTTLT